MREERNWEGSTGRPLMVRFGAARVKVLKMYCPSCQRMNASQSGGARRKKKERRRRKRGVEGAANFIDQLLDAVAQLVFLAVVAGDWREGLVHAVCCRATHIVDQVGQVLGGLELDAAVDGRFHGVSCPRGRRTSPCPR